MLTLSPHHQFLSANAKEAEALKMATTERWMAVALTHALASMSIGGATKDELNGARKFIDILLNLAEPIKPLAPSLPSKELGQNQIQEA